MARLVVPSGRSFHASAGDTLPPSQPAILSARYFWSHLPSDTDELDISKATVGAAVATTTAAASPMRRANICFPPLSAERLFLLGCPTLKMPDKAGKEYHQIHRPRL